MLIEIHTHSTYSHGSKVYYDGVNSPEEILKEAKKKSLRAIAITDHDAIEGCLEALKLQKKYNILVLPGLEVSTRQGHVLALGVEELIPKGLSIWETIDRIHQQGGLAVATHPFDIRREGCKDLARYCDAVEVFNSMNLDRISNKWAENLAREYNLPVTAGSDAHYKKMLGSGAVEISSDIDSVDGILKAIRNRKLKLRKDYASISDITQLSVRRLRLSYQPTLDYIGENYRQPKRFVARKLLSLVKRSPGKIDYLFKALAVIAYGGITAYGLFRNLLKL